MKINIELDSGDVVRFKEALSEYLKSNADVLTLLIQAFRATASQHTPAPEDVVDEEEVEDEAKWAKWLLLSLDSGQRKAFEAALNETQRITLKNIIDGLTAKFRESETPQA